MEVWIGCLACYNNGELVGDWVDAFDAEDFIPCSIEDHEEFWVMDHDGFAGILKGECSPHKAQRIANIISDAEQDHVDAGKLKAFMELWAEYIDEDIVEWDNYTSSKFSDVYMGEYHSMEDYARENAVEIYGIPEHLLKYIDWEIVTKDFEGSYTAVSSSDGKYVHIFWDEGW